MNTGPVRPSEVNLWCVDELYGERGPACGCPICCALHANTVVFAVEDFVRGVYPLGWWRKSVCTEKLALLVRERICPGWPGSTWKEGKRMGGGSVETG